MSTTTATHGTAPAAHAPAPAHAAAPPAPAKPATPEENAQRLLALIAADWVRGDKRHLAEVRALTLKALEALGEKDELAAEARTRLMTDAELAEEAKARAQAKAGHAPPPPAKAA